MDWFIYCREINGLASFRISSSASESKRGLTRCLFSSSVHDENLVFEEFARQNLKDVGENTERKKDEEAGQDE